MNNMGDRLKKGLIQVHGGHNHLADSHAEAHVESSNSELDFGRVAKNLSLRKGTRKRNVATALPPVI